MPSSSTLSEPMPLPTRTRRPSAGRASRHRPRNHHAWIPGLTGLAVVVLLLATAAFVWHDRQQWLREGESFAARQAMRLAHDLEQSLAVAHKAIEQAQNPWPMVSANGLPQPAPTAEQVQRAQERAELLSTLPLPFALRALTRNGEALALVGTPSPSATDLTGQTPSLVINGLRPGRWSVGLPEGLPLQRYIPFVWPAPPNQQGVVAYQADIAFTPLQARLESDRVDQGGGVALFRLEPDGRVTLLARAPFDEAHVGQRIDGPVAERLRSAEAGQFATAGHLDGIPRRTAFQRLAEPANSLVVSYGLPEAALLAGWHARLPWLVSLSGLLAALLAYGGYRLDRSLRALATSEQRFRLASASGHVWDWDGQTGVLQVPSVIWNNLGLDLPPPGRAVAVFTERLHPLDRERLKQLFVQHLQARQPFDTSFRLRDASGAYRWFETQGQADWGPDGRATYMAGTAFEITERRSLEEAQRQTLHRLDTVANASPALFWTADEDLMCDWVNHRWLRFTGQPLEGALGAQWIEGIHPDDRQRYQAICHHAYATRKAFTAEFRRRHHSGSYRWMLDQGMPRLDADGRFIGFIGASLDIHEQKALEQERERLSEFLVLLLRLASRFINLPLADLHTAIDAALGEIGRFVQADRVYVFTYDFQAQITRNTHEWCENGVAPEKDNLQSVALADIPDWVQTHLQGLPMYVEDVHNMPLGALRDILEPQGIRSLLTLPLMGHEGCLGFVGFDSVRDVHVYDDAERNLLELFAQMLVNVQERNLAETRLGQLAAELEARVQERTEQLHASVQRLSRANAELETFTYSVSHDLKTPLRSLEGFSTLLLEEHAANLAPEAQLHLQRIQRSARHMARLIQDLLNYSRLEKSPQVLQSLNLAQLVSQALAHQHDALQERGAQVEVHVASRLVVRASNEGMAMVMRNLIDNAMKFTRAGEAPRLHISAEDLGQQVRLTVADQGQGFDMKHHDRIFALFQRLHRPDQVAGTGIGLAMVHKAIERMDGRIWAESEPGQGARFHIELHSG